MKNYLLMKTQNKFSSLCTAGVPIPPTATTRMASHRQLMRILGVVCLLMSFSVGNVWGTDVTGTIYFNSGTGTAIDDSPVTGDDSQDNTWTITTVGTTSFTANASYYQVGSSKKPATSITFTTTLPSSQTIKSMSAKFGGFSGTAGTITLKVGTNSIGSGSLSETSDVTVSSTDGTKSGTVLTVTVTGISKGVKCYYISYTYDDGGGGGGGSCTECTYYVYNGSTWVSIGTTGFTDVVLAPPTLPNNNHAAGNGCWVTDKTKFDGGGCTTYASGSDYRYVPRPGGAAPDADNKPGSGVCELYAVYANGSGCFSTTVTAVQCARIWEEPEPNTPSVSGSDVTLSWSSVTGASGYHLYVTDGDSYEFDGDVNSTSKTLTGLAAGTYSWTVAANSPTNDACDSNPTDGDDFIIESCTDISGSTVSSANISVTPAKTTATISWSAVANASSYEVKVYAGATASGVAVWTASPDPTSTSCTATGLTANTQYTVAIKAKNACSTSSTAGTKTFTTLNLTLYTVTFHNAAGSTPSAVTQTTEGGSVSIPSASACEGWTFVGWKVESAQSEVTSDPTGSGTWITNATWPKSYTPTSNIDAYAVFSHSEGGSTPVVDQMTLTDLGVSGTSYSDFSGISITSDAVYAGQCAGGSSSIQLRTKNSNSGVIMTSSGGNVTNVTVTFNASTTTGKGIQVYGKNSAYSGASDLFNSSTYGTLLGTILKGTNTSLSISGDYAYIGFRSDDGAAYLDEVDITIGGGGTTTWTSSPDCASSATLTSITIDTPPTTTNYVVGQIFSSTGAVVTAHYDDSSSKTVTASWTPTTPLTAGTNQDVTASYTEGGVTKTATTKINVYAVTLQKKDNTNADIASTPPTVTLSVADLTASLTGNSYKFKEWTISGGTLTTPAVSGDNSTVSIASVSGPVTVTAVYYKPITVTWHVPSGTFDSETHAYGWNVQYPTSNPTPSNYGCDGKVFVGWTRSSSYSHASTPPTYVSSGESLTSDEHFYAVFATVTNAGTPPTWKVTSFGSVDAGTYVICLNNKKVFNGTISEGRGQITAGAFSSTLSGSFSEAAPVGACELTLSANSSGWNMYNAEHGYLYCKARTEGSLSWNASAQDYWFYSNSAHWGYHGYNNSGTYVAIYGYDGTTIRTYSSGTHDNIVLLKKTNAGTPATYSDYATSCSCTGYSFHTGTGTDNEVKATNTRTCFTQVNSSTTWQITDYTIPSDTKFFVGYQDEFVNSLGTSSRSAVKEFNADETMYFEYSKNYGDGYRPSVGNATGAIGTLRIWSDNNWDNCHVGFDPNGYIFKLGSTYYPMSNSTTLDADQYKETEVITLTSTDISGQFQVNIAAVAPNASTGVASRYTEAKNLTTMGVKSGSGNNWRATSIAAGDANTKGFFRIDKGNGGATNWNAHWVPCWELTFNLKGGTGTIATTPAYVSVEAASKVVQIPTTAPTKDGYRFMGWSDDDNNTVEYAAGSTHNVTLSGNKTVYAVWAQEYTITYDLDGGTASPACAGGTEIAGATVDVCTSTPTKAASTFNGWIAYETGNTSNTVTITDGHFTMPSHNVTVKATYNEASYALNHSGSNYTNTENKTTIKSSDTPLTLNYTCTGTYGFPSTISISGGGKASWTAGTDYTWTVGDSKQAAQLVIASTTISADVTITITMKTRYTVTYDFPQGLISGSSLTLNHYFVTGEAQTLKTVTSVSCAEFDTFEGWTTAANKITSDATSATGITTGSYTATANITFYAMYSHADAGATGYNKITSGVSDGTYLIATDKGSGTDYAYKSTTSHVSATVADGNIGSLPTGATEVTVTLGTGSNAGYFAISFDNSGTETYIYAYNGNGLSTSTSAQYDWSLDTDPSTLGEIHSRGQSTRYLQSNSSGSGAGDFKGYAHTQTPAYLYKKGGKVYNSTPSCATPTEIEVTYDANGGGAGSITCSNTTLTYGTYPKLAANYTICNTFNRSGYTLYKWHTRASGTGGTDFTPGETITTENTKFTGTAVTLYAQWRRKVSFDIGNATGSVADVIDEDGDGTITLPTSAGITSIPCEYTFYGWSETEVSTTNTKPTIYAAGASYSGSNATMYAVYKKATGTGSDPNLFTLSFISGGTTYYVKAPTSITTAPSEWTYPYTKTTKFATSTNAEDAVMFGMKNIAGQTYKTVYWLYNGDESEKAYMYWKDNGGSIQFETSEDDSNGWNISESAGTISFTGKQYLTKAIRYIVASTSEIYCNSDGPAYAFTKTTAVTTEYTYATNPSCSSTYTVTFNTHGGTFDGSSPYEYGDETTVTDIDPGTVIHLPAASYSGGWTFVGWKDSQQAEMTDSYPEGSEDGKPSGIIAAGTAVTINSDRTYHAVYHLYDEAQVIDLTEPLTTSMYVPDGEGGRHYITGTPGTGWSTMSSTSDCGAVSTVVITPGTGENEGKYSININGYNVIPQDGGSGLKRGDFWWTIEETSTGSGRYKIYGMTGKTHLVVQEGTYTFGHYAYNVGSSSYSGYSWPRFGNCREHHWTSEPEPRPVITLGATGTITVTSTQGKTIQAVNKLTLAATRYGETTKIYLSSNVAGVGFLKADGTALSSDGTGTYVSTDASGELSTTNIIVTYTPTATDDGIESVTITAKDAHSPSPLASDTRTAKVRHLPTKFIIAEKVGDDWYALPNDMSNSQSNPARVKITSVDEATGVATIYSDVTDYLAWTLGVTTQASKKYSMEFYSDLANDTKYLKTHTSSANTIGQYAKQTGTNQNYTEFKPTTSDLVDYTLYNEQWTYYLGISGDVWGVYSSSATVRFFTIDQQPAPTITWQNDMLGSTHATNKAENGVITLPTGADPLSCNTTVLPTFCGWKDGQIATYASVEPTYVQAGDAATTDKTYYAVFKEASRDRWYTSCPTIYSITYTANGGEGADYVAYTMNTTADAVTVETAGFTKEGSTFVGWTNPDDLEGAIITPGTGKITGLSGDITLNAVWMGTVNVSGTVRLTASAGEKVATATDAITISSADLACATALRITYRDVTNSVTYGRSGSPTYTTSEFRLCNSSYNAADGSNISLAEVSGAYNQTYSITYEPDGGANTLDEYELVVEVLLKNTVIDTKTLSLYGRTLPSSFAIATKIAGNWYALPNNMSSSGKWDPILISVTEDASVLNWTAQGPTTAAYTMKDYTSDYSYLRFAADDANAYCLWAATGNEAGIRNWSASSTDANYAWTATPDEYFNAYTLANKANTRTALRVKESQWSMQNSGGYYELHFIPLTTAEPITMKVAEWYPTKVLVQTTSALPTSPSAPAVTIDGTPAASPTCVSKGTNLYEIGGLDLEGNPNKIMTISYTAAAVDYAGSKVIPIIISRSTKDVADEPFATLTKEVYNNVDLVVRDGAVLTINGTVAQNTFFDVTIYPTAKISVPETNVNSNANKLSLHSLTFFGGIDDIYNGSSYTENKYGVPELSLKGTLGKTVPTIDYLMRVDLDQMYRVGVPYDVNMNGITYWDGSSITPGTQLYVSAYDGQKRANMDLDHAWVWETSFEGYNANPALSTAKLKQGIGYTISAEPQNVGDPYSIIRLPMASNIASGNTEAAKTVPVEAYDNQNSETITPNNKGWNYMCNPYMASISGGDGDTKLVVGYLEQSGSQYVWNTTESVRYVTIPADDGRSYTQQKYSEATLQPFKSFFVQVGTSGDMSFELANRVNAPARYLQAAEREVEFEIVLSNDERKDHTGLLIAEQYTPAYEINADLEKMENPMSVYTLTSGFKLAYNALSPEDAKLPIPVGYIADVAGTYIFQLDENSVVDEVEHIWLTDYEQDRVADLMDETYEFTTLQGRNEMRFALTIELRDEAEVPTGVDEQSSDRVTDKPVKFIWNDKIYILNHGVIYDATGKRVNVINK